MFKRFRFATLAAALSFIPACVDGDSNSAESQPDASNPDLAETPGLGEGSDGGEAVESVAAAACQVSGTNVNRSLVVTDSTALAKFSFTRVMDQLRSTAGVSAVQTNVGIFQAWWKTFGSSSAAGDCNDAGIDPERYGLVCPRAPERAIGSTNPFLSTSSVKFKPIGVFNRFDLTPTNGANCGEYRIVYSMTTSGSAPVSGPAFIIFEATLPNPTPAAGANACLPVAKFWQSLTADASATSRAAKLEKFYFTGGAVAGFPSVVRAAHYGLANGATAAFTAGQIRTNSFANGEEWNLREFKLRKSCTSSSAASCRLKVQHVPVKASPAEELFAGTHARSSSFRTAFVNQIPNLIKTSVANISMDTSNVFNEFESISNPGSQTVLYRQRANSAMRSAIQAKLTALGSNLTPNNILDRATTQSCAGCHTVSDGVALGGGLTFPATNGFTHIEDRSGPTTLSPALTGVFLPRRKQVLEQFINSRCTTALAATASGAIVDTGLTLGGSAVGAPN